MRLWSLAPKYLDSKGLVAMWREGLLARRVLLGDTKGYTRHPQLLRFRQCGSPVAALDRLLHTALWESLERGYAFDAKKIGTPWDGTIAVTDGQLEYEMRWLMHKVSARSPGWHENLQQERNRDMPVEPNSLFHVVPGRVEYWEKVK